MRVRVNQSVCQGHTICSMLAPAVFELDDVDGHAQAIPGDVPTDLEGNVHEAILSCPERAIAEVSHSEVSRPA
jgi:ferredoxin